MQRKELFTEIPYIEGERLTIKEITQADAPALQEMVDSEAVYRLEPSFLFEKKYDDVHYVIDHLYDEAFKESIIMGIYLKDLVCEDDRPSGAGQPEEDGQSGGDGQFCGLAEFYGYRDDIHKVSIGIRLMERYWGMGIGAETLNMLVDYLYNETDIEIIAASSLPDNHGSAGILRKCGFDLVVHNGLEDWGFGEPQLTDKWIK